MTANGQLSANQLVSYRGVWLAPQAAADAARMEAAAAKAGFTMRPVGSKNGAAGYRSVSTQEDMHVHPTDYGLLPSPPAPPLAPVGYSRHGQARALDIASASAGSAWRAWLLKNGPTYHWISWRLSDPNHFEHGVGDVVTITEAGLAPAGSSTKSLYIGEEIMTLWIYDNPNDASNNGKVVVANPANMTYRYVGGLEKDALIQDNGAPHPLNAADWSATLSPYREIKAPDEVSAGSGVTTIIAALKDPTVLSALATAIKVPTKITGTLS